MVRFAIVFNVSALLLATASLGQQPAFHGNVQRIGYSALTGPTRVAVKWKLNLGGAILSSPVIGPDGTIYLGSVLNDTKHPEHFIVAVQTNGTLRWRFKTGFQDTQVQSSPAIGLDGKIYVGSQNDTFYALYPDGTLAWKYEATGPVNQHAAVAQDGTVYVGIDGRLHAFTSNGTLKWTVDLGSNLDGGPSLSPDERTIYAFGYNPVGPLSSLYAFRQDGSLKWRNNGFYPYYPANSPPTITADGTVLVLSGAIVALNPANGALKWSYTPSAAYYNSFGALSVTPAGDVVFAFDRFLGKLRADGSLLWQQEFLGGVYGNEVEGTWCSPLVDSVGNIYLGLGTGKRWTRDWGKVVRAYSPTGTLLWEFGLDEGVYTSSPALGADGTLYLGAMDGYLYALGNSSVNLASLTLNPNTVTWGRSSTGTVSLNAPAPGDVNVRLSTSTHSAIVPAGVTIPAGRSNATFTLSAASGPPEWTDYATISSRCNGVIRTALLTIRPAPGPWLQTFSIFPGIVRGGNQATGTVSLTAAAPAGGATVALSSSNPAVAAIPATVAIPAGAWDASFTVSTFAVSNVISTTLSAAYDGVTKTEMFTVNPLPPPPPPWLVISPINNEQFQYSSLLCTGVLYQLQQSADLHSWSSLGNPIPGSNLVFHSTISFSPPARYFRLTARPAP